MPSERRDYDTQTLGLYAFTHGRTNALRKKGLRRPLRLHTRCAGYAEPMPSERRDYDGNPKDGRKAAAPNQCPQKEGITTDLDPMRTLDTVPNQCPQKEGITTRNVGGNRRNDIAEPMPSERRDYDPDARKIWCASSPNQCPQKEGITTNISYRLVTIHPPNQCPQKEGITTTIALSSITPSSPAEPMPSERRDYDVLPPRRYTRHGRAEPMPSERRDYDRRPSKPG